MTDVEKGETVSANAPPRHQTHQSHNHGAAGLVAAGYDPSPYYRPLANPGPLGLFSFASTTLILSLYNAHARHILVPNIVVGMALFCGGLAQLLAGMWEFAAANTFGATAFSSYGAFWLSYAAILIPGSGIGAAYTADEAAGGFMIHDAIGIFLLTWMVVTFLFFVAALRRTLGQVLLFGFLTLTFLCLAVGELVRSTNTSKAGGWLGVLTALIAYYVGFSELLTANDIFTLPLGSLKKRL
ncbi:hypothetical protein FA95DRAFT_1681986 [Auriscalpium vulgare]|uniref:Uncharacterized protein n=1 Tax=Auriscalpium vulgare TaxID=40419 RepID=A0ACB8RHX8_9AGAM|nr:hypothetical protein FA95DRAFT_1681986 [Auriscalpium vulgare]